MQNGFVELNCPRFLKQALMVQPRVGCPGEEREPRLEKAGEDIPRLGKSDSALPPKSGHYKYLQK